MTPAADQDFTGNGNGTVHTVNYTLATDATHIKITMLTRSGGRINIDYLLGYLLACHRKHPRFQL